eukprot:5375695-Pleurochrysis_carterae.AAC.1
MPSPSTAWRSTPASSRESVGPPLSQRLFRAAATRVPAGMGLLGGGDGHGGEGEGGGGGGDGDGGGGGGDGDGGGGDRGGGHGGGGGK